MDHTASYLPSLFTSLPSSLILISHDSYLSPQFPPFHCRRVRVSSPPASSASTNPSRFLHPPTTPPSLPSTPPRPIPPPPPPPPTCDRPTHSHRPPTPHPPC